MLVDDDVLIDAGTGIGDLPLGDLDPIRHVFLTHAHLDHVAGLPMLVDHVFDENFDQPLTVYARQDFYAVDVMHTVPCLGFTVQNSGGVFAVSGDTKTNETLWPVLNACDDLRVLVIEVSFPDEMQGLAIEAGHYTPKTLTEDLARLKHRPEIWLTGMKPGEEQRILQQVTAAAPDRHIRMLSAGTVLTV